MKHIDLTKAAGISPHAYRPALAVPASVGFEKKSDHDNDINRIEAELPRSRAKHPPPRVAHQAPCSCCCRLYMSEDANEVIERHTARIVTTTGIKAGLREL